MKLIGLAFVACMTPPTWTFDFGVPASLARAAAYVLEPPSAVLMGLGLLALAAHRRLHALS